jgi:hypothetical protein
LPFVFAFADAFQDSEAGFLGVGKGDRPGGVESGKDFADRAATSGADLEFRGVNGALEGKVAVAHGAIAFAEFIFV